MDGIAGDRANWVVNHLLVRDIRCERCNCAYDDVPTPELWLGRQYIPVGCRSCGIVVLLDSRVLPANLK